MRLPLQASDVKFVISGVQADTSDSMSLSDTSFSAESRPQTGLQTPPKQVRKWCNTLKKELVEAMTHLEQTLSPERPSHTHQE